jgi:hypothetical protein
METPNKRRIIFLYTNKNNFGGFQKDSYWSSKKGKNVIAWRLNFDVGYLYDKYNRDNTAWVRPFRSILTKIQNPEKIVNHFLLKNIKKSQ